MEERKRMSYEEAYALVAKQDTVDVKPIIRERPFFKKGHDGEFMFTRTVKVYQIPISNSIRGFSKIFDTPKEQEAFEILLGEEPGALSTNNLGSTYWNKFKVEMTKEGRTLDLSIPYQALEYRVLKANYKRIAPDWESRHKAGLEFALVNDAQVRADESKRTDLIEKAMDLFYKVKKSNAKMYNVLRLLEKIPPKEVADNTQFLKTEIMKVIEQKEKVRGTGKSIHDFIEVAEDKQFDTKVLIYDAMDANEIKMGNGGMFKLSATDAVMGKSIQQVADWLDNLQNQEDKIILQQILSK